MTQIVPPGFWLSFIVRGGTLIGVIVPIRRLGFRIRERAFEILALSFVGFAEMGGWDVLLAELVIG